MVKTSPMQAINAAWGGNRPPNPVSRTFQETRQERPITSILPVPPTVFTTGITAFVTAGPLEYLRLETFVLHNPTAGVISMQVFLVEDGGAASVAANEIYQKASFAARGTDGGDAIRGIVLSPGSSLRVQSNPAGGIAAATLTRITQGQS